MKRLEISKLMDEYQDNDFFPEGSSTVDVHAVKNRVLTEANAVPAKKQRVPPLKAALLAAVLAVGCVAMIGAGIPEQVYHLICGAAVTSRGLFYDIEKGIAAPISLENGRLWFTGDGQRIDLSETINADTPYIYTSTDEITGSVSYTIVGGTPENFGWVEFISVDGQTSCLCSNAYTEFVLLDGTAYARDDLTSEQEAQLSEMNNYPLEIVNHPWLDAAEKELDIDFFS